MKTRLVLIITIIAVMAIQINAAVIQISSFEELYNIGRNSAYPLNGHYELTQDIDASSKHSFLPTPSPFTGTFDGKGYIIKNLYMGTNSGNGVRMGLFYRVDSGGEIKNVGLENVYVSGNSYEGSLAAELNGGKITNCYSTGKVFGTNYTGGLVGRMLSGTITGCYATEIVVAGDNKVGMLVGEMSGGKIVDCYSNGEVAGGFERTSSLGGLVGLLSGGEITNCYSTVYQKRFLGSDALIGGLIGSGNKIVTNCYWDIETSTQNTSAAGEGRTTTQMKQLVNYTGWDFETIWQIDEGKDYPYLRSIATSVIGNTINRKALSTFTPLVTTKGKTLNIKAASNSELQIRLVDMRGKTVARFNTRGSGSFSLSKIPAGRYFVEMRESGKRVAAPAVVLR